MISVQVRQKGTQEGFVDEDEDESAKSKSFTWDVMSFDQTSMDIKIDFEKPSKISSDQPDIVRVTFEDTSLLYDYTG